MEILNKHAPVVTYVITVAQGIFQHGSQRCSGLSMYRTLRMEMGDEAEKEEAV